MAQEFYLSLYTQEPVVSSRVTNWNFSILDARERVALNLAVTRIEVRTAFFDMGPNKAPGPDGLPVFFFQKFWTLIGPTVTDFMLQIFETGVLPPTINDSLVCLIPKVEAPEHLSQFRPISLCNVIVKAISKVLANRLKPVMEKLMGSGQTSFIPGRSATDNIIAAQEFLHTVRHRKGNRAGFVLKVDLEKAYERVSWSFLEEVLRVSGFGVTFRNLIMATITTTSLAVCWNGDALQPFRPSRGLRQGDPLSLYLFVLCMEVLGQLVLRSVTAGEWKPVAVSLGGPSVSHLFFADALLLYGEASFSQARLMEHTLATFCGISGQKVNRPNPVSGFLRICLCTSAM